MNSAQFAPSMKPVTVTLPGPDSSRVTVAVPAPAVIGREPKARMALAGSVTVMLFCAEADATSPHSTTDMETRRRQRMEAPR